MAQKDRSTLKSFFETGDIPTEGNYTDLIDSSLSLAEGNTGNINLTGEITASGNISSSGTLTAESLSITNVVTTHVTASSISSSGDLIASRILINEGNELDQMVDFVSLLGVKGGPAIRPGSNMPTSTLIHINGKNLLVDTGLGVSRSICDQGVELHDIDAIFITHMHSDHIADLPDAHLQSWVQGRTAPLKVFGPEGINLITKGFELAYSPDYQYRNEHHGDDMLPMSVAGFNAIQITDNQLIPNDTPGLEILPFVVDHYPVNSSFGFKVSYKGRTVVISGDTIHDGSVQKYSKDVDLLVHSAISIDIVERMRKLAPIPQMDKILLDIQDYHTSIKEAGEIARDANVKHLLIYHSIPTPRNTLMERVFFRPIEGIFEDYTLSDDGTRVIMPVGNNEIVIDKIN